MSWLYLKKERAKVFSKFLSFANEIKTQHSAVIKKFRSHNALEYLSSTSNNILTLMASFTKPHVPILHSIMD